MNSRGASAEGRGYLSNGGGACPFLKPGGEFFIYLHKNILDYSTVL